MPLSESLFNWLCSLSYVESFEILTWLGLIIRAKVLGLRLDYNTFRSSLERLNEREPRIQTRNPPLAADEENWSSQSSHTGEFWAPTGPKSGVDRRCCVVFSSSSSLWSGWHWLLIAILSMWARVVLQPWGARESHLQLQLHLLTCQLMMWWNNMELCQVWSPLLQTAFGNAVIAVLSNVQCNMDTLGIEARF